MSNSSDNIINVLMPRNVTKDLKDISYEKYLDIRNNNKYIKLTSDNNLLSKEYIEFDNRLQFLIDTKVDLKLYHKDLLEVWSMCINVINQDSNAEISCINTSYLYSLVSIIGEANFPKEDNLKIISDLESCIRNRFENYLKQNLEFAGIINELITWYSCHYQYLKYLTLTFNTSEIGYLKKLFENNITKFETLKSSAPKLYIQYIEIVKSMFKSIDTDYKSKFKIFYLEICLQEIIVAKNSGFYDKFEILLEDYYSEKFSAKKHINCLFKYLTGYGEKPWRLVGLFLFVNVVFSLIFTFLPFEFHYTINPTNQCETFFYFLSFNNTTMLTVGYGDIYPEGIGARIFVAGLQLLGFVISSSAIALFLRKILRF